MVFSASIHFVVLVLVDAISCLVNLLSSFTWSLGNVVQVMRWELRSGYTNLLTSDCSNYLEGQLTLHLI